MPAAAQPHTAVSTEIVHQSHVIIESHTILVSQCGSGDARFLLSVGFTAAATKASLSGDNEYIYKHWFPQLKAQSTSGDVLLHIQAAYCSLFHAYA